jgi:HJR/Mrr/RecB family endonuclease
MRVPTHLYYDLIPDDGNEIRLGIERRLSSIEVYPVQSKPTNRRSEEISREVLKERLDNADFIIADLSSIELSGKGRNLLWDLGYASAKGLRQIFILNKKYQAEKGLLLPTLLGSGVQVLLYDVENLEPFFLHLVDAVASGRKQVELHRTNQDNIFSKVIYSTRDQLNLPQQIQSVKKRIWILTTNLDYVSNELSPYIVEALNDPKRPNLTLQICTQDSYSNFVAERAAQMAIAEPEYRYQLHNSVLTLKSILRRCDRKRWDVRMYDTFPTQISFGFDDRVFTSFLAHSRRSRQALHFALRESQADPFLEHFDQLFYSGHSIHDQFALYDTDEPPSPLVEVIHLVSDELIRYLQKRPADIYSISPRQFEELVAELLASFGCEVQLTASTKDGGYDIFAVSKDISGMKTSWIIECKKYAADRKVGIEIARALYSVKTDLKVANAVLATTTHFTKGVKNFKASRYDFELRDYQGILEWINCYRPNPGGHLYLKDRQLIV